MLAHLRIIHERMRDDVTQQLERAPALASEVDGVEGGDVVYAIDRVSESALLRHFDGFARRWPCVLISEGLGADGTTVLPRGARAEDAEVRVLVDPIDGTRGLMYDKRSAWILTGVAPNLGSSTRLSDIVAAVQTEIPTSKQYLADCLWAIAGSGSSGERYNRLTGERHGLSLRPSRATGIEHGFGAVCRFFPGGRALLAAVDDLIVERLAGPPTAGAPTAFEDQYISSAGQVYELVMGHDRWIADLRPLLRRMGVQVSCAHPYDLCTALIGREAGIVLHGLDGKELSAPLDVHTDVGWVGFANTTLAEQVMPALRDSVHEAGLMP